MPSKYTQPFLLDSYYHVYNRSINREPLFFNHSNYSYFLNLYREKVSPYTNTLAYCLLPNHFHLLIEIPNNANIEFLKNGFRSLFISYSQAINKQEGRHGSLFCKPFKRKRIDSNEYLSHAIAYIHQNPQLHGLVENFRDYKWSSYLSIISDFHTLLDRQKVLDWFGGKDPFIDFHDSMLNIKELDLKNEF